MIPTHSKTKLAQHMSYPIGAEALTEGLSDGPHIESFSVTFFGWGFQKLLARGKPYMVLQAEYRPSRNPGYGGKVNCLSDVVRWELTVYPVLRELRHVANSLIRERGLPLVIQWLRASERAGWLSHDQHIELVFDPAEGTLSALESSGA